MPIATVTPFAMTANTPVTVTAAITIVVQNLSPSAIFYGEVGAVTTLAGHMLAPKSSITLTFPTATAIDLLSPVSLPAGEVRVQRIT